MALIVVAPAIVPALVIPPLELFNDLVTVSPSASTEKPVIVIVPIVKSPLASILVAPDKAPEAKVAVPSVKLEAVIELVTLRVPAIEVLPLEGVTTNLSLLILRSPDISIEVKVPCIGSVEPMEMLPDLILTLFIVILEKSISVEPILLVLNVNVLLV